MKKFKLIILSLLISTSASAQQPSLPELDLPDLTLEENAEGNNPAKTPDVTVSNETKSNIPALPSTLQPVATNKEQDKVLNKAIDEVFKEPDTKNTAEENKDLAPAIEENTKIPAALNDPSVKVIEVSPTQPLIEKNSTENKTIEEQTNNDNPEVPAVIQPEETQAAEALENSTKNKEVVEEEQPKENVIVEKKEPVKKKVQPKKSIVFPTQTPKSLKQNYNNPLGELEINNFSPTFDRNIINQNIEEEIKYDGLPENTKPIMLNNLWQNQQKTENILISKNELINNKAEEKPKSLRYTSIIPDDLEKNLYRKNSKFSEAKKKSNSDLDILSVLPEKKEKLKIKSEISIDEAKFNNPFPEDITFPTPENTTLVESEVQQSDKDIAANQDNVPVVDFSENQIENIDDLAPTMDEMPQGFYTKELGLKVEVKDRPANSLGVMRNAYEALQVGQYESAIEYYKEALQVNPNNGKARFGLATSYHKSKQYDNAKEEYLKIINKNPDFWPAVNNYIMLVSEEDPASSINKLENLRQKNPDFAAIPAQLGSLYYNKGELEKASKNYIDALEIEPENIDYKYNLAVILEKSGNILDAAEVYRSLLEDSAKGKKLPENPIIIKDRYDMLTSKARG